MRPYIKKQGGHENSNTGFTGQRFVIEFKTSSQTG